MTTQEWSRRGGARKGAGRKPLPEGKKKITFCRSVSKKEFKLLDEKLNKLRNIKNEKI